MNGSTLFSSTEESMGWFSQHGLVNLETDGNIAIYDAWGPFNEELLAANIAMHKRVIPRMRKNCHRGAIATFHCSAMASPKTIQRFAEYLKTSALNGRAFTITAFVMAYDIDGAGFMRHLLANFYADAGLSFKVFPQLNEAQAWLKSELEIVNQQTC